MKNTERLKLSFWDSLNHYLIVLFAFLPMIFSIYHYFELYILKSYTGVRTPREMFNVSIPFTLAGMFLFYIQYSRLKFKVLETSLSKKKILELISETAQELEWREEIKSVDIKVFKTYPKWSTGSWGEQISIVFDNKKILINSVCDPDKNSSIASFGRNKKNVNTLISKIVNASC